LKESFVISVSESWRPKSTNIDHTKKSQDIEHEPIVQKRSDRMMLRYAYYKPFTVKFPAKCKQQNGLNPDNNGGLVWYWTGPRPIKALVLGCTDGA
jgi:hypothetical protein